MEQTMLAAIKRAAREIYPHHMDENKRKRVESALADLSNAILAVAASSRTE